MKLNAESGIYTQFSPFIVANLAIYLFSIVSKQKFCSITEYYNKYFISNILYRFQYYVFFHVPRTLCISAVLNSS